MSGVHHQPDGAAFDVVLLLHVGCVAVGLVTAVAATTTAARLRRLLLASSPLPGSLRRYFRPGVNWAGRSIYGIPAFGFALLAMSQGTYALGDAWVLAGLALFVALGALAEGVMWPAERRLQSAVTAAGLAEGSLADATSMGRDAATMVRAGGAVLALLVVGTVVMVAQP
jgi:uncharacterized membrane protein